MKLSYLANLVGLDPAKTNEREIKQRLEAALTRANEAGEGTAYQQVSGMGQRIGPGTNMYSSPRIAADSDTDPHRNIDPYIVKSNRPGFWQIYERQPDGSYVKFGVESIGLDDLKGQVQKLNAKVRAKGSKANEVLSLVNECMEKRGLSYGDAFCQVRKTRSDLFASMADPAPAQKAAHTPKARR